MTFHEKQAQTSFYGNMILTIMDDHTNGRISSVEYCEAINMVWDMVIDKRAVRYYINDHINDVFITEEI